MANGKNTKQPEDIFDQEQGSSAAKPAARRFPAATPSVRSTPTVGGATQFRSPRSWLVLGAVILGFGVLIYVGILVYRSFSTPEEATPAVNTAEPTILPTQITIPSSAPDTDADGLTDAEEQQLGTRIDTADSDGDKLFDREEVKLYHSDPLKSDTDGDGVTDGDEVAAGTDPTGPGVLRDLQKEIQKLDTQ